MAVPHARPIAFTKRYAGMVLIHITAVRLQAEQIQLVAKIV
jgi:hypothetical protein